MCTCANMLAVLVIAYLIVYCKSQLEEIFESDYPHAAFLDFQCLSRVPNQSTSWRCGSSVVNQYMLLTAAHCVDPTSCDEITIEVTVGQTEKVMGTTFSVHSFIIHEDYTPRFQADIALLRLMSPLELYARVSRVALMENPPYEEEAEIVGWKNKNISTESLRSDVHYSNHGVRRRQDCVGIMDDLPNGTFCASGYNDDYVLNADPGTALIVRDYVQIGICSYIEPKDVNTIFIFTDVGYYYNWIADRAPTIIYDNIDKELWRSVESGERTANESDMTLRQSFINETKY